MTNYFTELLEKWAKSKLSKDYKDGFEDGFKAGVRESANTLSQMQSIVAETFKEVRKHDK